MWIWMKVHTVIFNYTFFSSNFKVLKKRKEYKSSMKKLTIFCKYFLEIYFHLNFIPWFIYYF